jgi:hypothetical protein
MVISQKMNLINHCIQTAAQIRLRELLSAITLLDEPHEKILQEYDMLKTFLETEDFAQLRADRPELAGGTDIDIIVTQTEQSFTVLPSK